MDIYDGVTTIAGAHDSTDTSSVSRSQLVSRFGNLQGFSAGSFGNLSGYGLWASGSVYLEGKIIAREGGTISNWTINENSLSAAGIQLTGGNTPSIQIGAANTFTAGSGIFMSGSSVGALFRIGQESGSNNKFIQWNNSDLIINSSNFRLADGNVSMSGTVSATTGLIGGWTIGTNQLYSGNVTLSSISGNSYLGIGSSEYDSTGIYIGSKSVGGNRLSLVSGANKLLWDGSNLGISTSNFTLNQGNITAKGGTVGGWNIGEKLISGSATNTNIAIRTVSSSNWNAVTNSGVGYAELVDSELFGQIGTYFVTADPILDVYSGSAYLPAANNHNISFISRYQNNNALLARFRSPNKFTIPANKTAYFGFKQVSISSEFLAAEYSDTIGYSITSSAGNLLT